MRRNIELKACCADLSATRERALAIGAAPQGVLVQTDTYFHVPHGRLKLREIDGSGAELIWYARPDSTALRASEYVLSPVADSQTLGAALAAALGVRGIVRKRRELFLWHNVRIHLDEVESLGSFIEFEAVLGEQDDERQSHARLAQVVEALRVRDSDRVAYSYGEMVREKKESPGR